MKEIPVEERLVACCGLYCGACGAYAKGRCPGCLDNKGASWCKVRACCLETGRRTCAECETFEAPSSCGKFNNLISKLFGLLFRSDRAACIEQVKKLDLAGHAEEMANSGRQSLKRR